MQTAICPHGFGLSGHARKARLRAECGQAARRGWLLKKVPFPFAVMMIGAGRCHVCQERAAPGQYLQAAGHLCPFSRHARPFVPGYWPSGGASGCNTFRARRWRRSLRQILGFGSEPNTAALCAANMILRGDGSARIRQANSLTLREFPAGDSRLWAMFADLRNPWRGRGTRSCSRPQDWQCLMSNGGDYEPTAMFIILIFFSATNNTKYA